jgi:RNA polymerase-binding protein DksA
MDAATLETYRQRLLAIQQQIVRRIFEHEEDLHRLETEREIERTDRVQGVVPEEVLQRLDEQGRREIDAVQAALARIAAGTYGTCESCGKTITPARLDAWPMARRCIRCQEQMERTARG